MTKIAVLGVKQDQAAVIGAMHDLKAVHIKEHKPGDLDIGSPLENAEEISDALVKGKSLLQYWNEQPAEESTLNGKAHKSIKTINKIHAEVQGLQDKLRKASEHAKQLHEEHDTARVLKHLGIKNDYRSLNTVRVLVGIIKQPKKLAESLALSEFPQEHHTVTHNDTTYVAVAVKNEDVEALRRIIQPAGFQEKPLADVRELKTITKDLKDAIAAKRAVKRDLEDAKKQHAEYVRQAVPYLEQEAEKAEAPLKFASSEHLFALTGFVPTTDLIVIKDALERAAKNRLHVDVRKPEKGESIPVKLNHPKPVKYFQFFMDLYNLPQYKEFDPTFFTFLTFPFLFGLMLGDMGYGVVTLILWLVLRKKMPKARGFFNILITASLWTIIWGFLFGEVFGAEVLFGHDLWRIMSRLHQINDLLILSLIVGVIHVNLGLIIGFFNELNAHGLKAAILEKVSWVILQVSAVFFYFSYAVPIFQYWVPYAILGLSLVMLYLGEGIRGLIEFPAIFSNILSYARLMAIGLASAGLAIVVNDFTAQFISMGLWGLIPAILIFAIGHVINIALGILGPFLHSLRLHYVEFFSRFFKGGGQRFTPFGTKD